MKIITKFVFRRIMKDNENTNMDLKDEKYFSVYHRKRKTEISKQFWEGDP